MIHPPSRSRVEERWVLPVTTVFVEDAATVKELAATGVEELVTVPVGELDELTEVAVVAADEPADADGIVFVEAVLEDEEVLEATVEVGVE